MKYFEKYNNNFTIGDDNNNNNNNNNKNDDSIQLRLAGIITMCSLPPSGNGKMTLRFLRRSIWQSYQITIGFAMKQCCTNIELCRTLFFDPTMDDITIQRYQSHFQRDSKITIDLLDLSKQLPSKHIHANNGTATFIHRRSTDNDNKNNHQHSFPPCCVIGARHDFIVDTEAVLETARYFHSDHPSTNNNTNNPPLVTWIDSTHDVMLGSKDRKSTRLNSSHVD